MTEKLHENKSIIIQIRFWWSWNWVDWSGGGGVGRRPLGEGSGPIGDRRAGSGVGVSMCIWDWGTHAAVAPLDAADIAQLGASAS